MSILMIDDDYRAADSLNLLLVEDDYRSSAYEVVLTQEKYTVNLVENLYDALEALENYGQNYKAVILDLAMSGNYLPEDGMKEKVIKDGIPAGCVFHMDVMIPKYQALAEKTIFFTGIPHMVKDTAPTWWYEKYSSHIVPKTETGFNERIIALLKKWNNE